MIGITLLVLAITAHVTFSFRFNVGRFHLKTALHISLEQRVPLNDYVSLQAKETVRDSISIILNEIEVKNEKVVNEIRQMKEENYIIKDRLITNKEAAKEDATKIQLQVQNGIINVQRYGLVALGSALLYIFQPFTKKLLEVIIKASPLPTWWKFFHR